MPSRFPFSFAAGGLSLDHASWSSRVRGQAAQAVCRLSEQQDYGVGVSATHVRDSWRTAADATANRKRRGLAPLIVLAVVLSLMLASAFLVDLGLMVARRSQLQAQADSAALQLAKSPTPQLRARLNEHGDSSMAVESIQRGRWDARRRQFIPQNAVGSAVRVALRWKEGAQAASMWGLGHWWSRFEFAGRTSAVARVVPRDVFFVVDLSGAMNDLSSPLRSTRSCSGSTELASELFSDLGFGAYPGLEEPLGTLVIGGIRCDPPDDGERIGDIMAALSVGDGPLTTENVPPAYRIAQGDSEEVRRIKAYSAVIDLQLRRVLSNVRPAPSVEQFAYWKSYIDYLILSGNWCDRTNSVGRPCGGESPYDRCEKDRRAPWPVGYRTYLQFLLDNGRDRKPDGIDYAPLSQYHAACPAHLEPVGGRLVAFLPREQPMHGARRAMVSALIRLEAINMANEGEDRDRAAIIGFDSLRCGGPAVWHPLDDDYAGAITAAARLQAAGEVHQTRALDAALERALCLSAEADRTDHRQSSGAREKIAVILLAGRPQTAAAAESTVEAFVSSDPSAIWSEATDHALRAAMVQVERLRRRGWRVFVVSLMPSADRAAELLARTAAGSAPLDEHLRLCIEGKASAAASETQCNGEECCRVVDPVVIERSLTAVLLRLVEHRDAEIVE